MNIMTQCLCIFALIGLIDKFMGNHMGLGVELDEGMKPFTNLVISAAGFYVFGLTLVRSNTEFFIRLAEKLPFDVSIVIGCLLSSDLGAAPMSDSIARTAELGYFGGTMVGSGLGMSISFLLPVFFTMIPSKDYEHISKGFICGVLTLPLGLLASGYMLGISTGTLLMNMLPVLILCAILLVAFQLTPENTLKALGHFGEFIRKLSVALFMVIVASMFFPAITWVNTQLVYELLYIVLRIMVTCGGGMVVAHLVLKYMEPAIKKASDFMGVNLYSVIGLFLSMISSVAMLGVFHKMDKRGKVANIAFNICGSHIIGGQMAFIAGLEPPHILTIYAVNKAIAGVTAALLALWITRSYISKDSRSSGTSKLPE